MNGEKVANAKKALEFFVSHGGCVDLADNDGLTVRILANKMPLLARHFMQVSFLIVLDITSDVCTDPSYKLKVRDARNEVR